MKTRPLNPEESAMVKANGIDLSALRGCTLCQYQAGEMMIRQGTPVEYLYLVLRGKIKVRMLAANGKDLTLCYYMSSGLLGDVELVLENKAASATSVADLPTDCVRIPLSHNGAFLTNNAAFMNRVARGLSMKLLNSSNALVSSALYAAEERLCTFILLTERHGMFTGVLADTAKAIGISYRHLFRLLNHLCGKGVLEKSSSGYLILDKQYLLSKCACI